MTSKYIRKSMKKRKKKFLISVLVAIMLLVSHSVAYAETSWELEAKKIDNPTVFSDGSMSRISGTPRGQLISSFELSITDRGNGTVGLFGAILCHEPMREIRMNLYLDIWDADTSDWVNVETYRFIWDESNTTEEERTAGVVAFDVDNLERGRDYRLRGLAGAYSLDSTVQESWKGDSTSIQVQSLN